jgi:hypothetical protein
MLKRASKRSNSSLSLLLFLMLVNVDEMEEQKRASVINKNNKNTHPSGNYSSFSNGENYFCRFLMLLGRLEILPIYFYIGNLFLFNRRK